VLTALSSNSAQAESNLTFDGTTVFSPQGNFSTLLTLGEQVIYPQGLNGFSVNEDFNAAGLLGSQVAYHFTTGLDQGPVPEPSNKSIVFDLAVSGRYTTMFGTYGDQYSNNFVIGSDVANTTFQFKNNLHIGPVELSAGNTLMTIQNDGLVGIGPTGPQYPLDVSGQVNTNSYYNLTNPNDNTFVGYHPINVGLTGSGSCNTGVGFMALRDISANTSPVVFNNLYDISGNWISVAMSSDGQYQTVVGAYDPYTSQLGYVYDSSDYGVTWVIDPSFAISDTSDNYVQISMSGDGQSAVIISDLANGGSGNILVKSVATSYQWYNPGFLGPTNWTLCAVSKDASLFVGVFFDGSNYNCWLSYNGGINWSYVFLSNNITCIYLGNPVVGLNRGIYIQNVNNNANIWYTHDVAKNTYQYTTILNETIYGLAVCTPDGTHDLVILASPRYLYIYSVENNTVSSPFFDLTSQGLFYVNAVSNLSITSDGTKIEMIVTLDSLTPNNNIILVFNTQFVYGFTDSYVLISANGYAMGGETAKWNALAISSNSQYLTVASAYLNNGNKDGYVSTSSTANNVQNNSFNTSIGYNSGQIVQTGVGNTFLGAATYSTYENVNYSTSIGYGSYVTRNHQIVFGSNMESSYVPGKLSVGYNQSYQFPLTPTNINFVVNGISDFNDGFQNSLLSYKNNNVSGTQNTSLGVYSLSNITSGKFNTSVGYLSASPLTSGEGNTSLGTVSLSTLTTGNNNTSVGCGALDYTNGDSNVALGYYAAGNYFGNNGTDGVQNTFLGYQTDISSGTIEPINNSTAIGANATIYQSHQVVLGTSAETINIPCGILNFLDYTNPNMSSPNYNIILNDVTGKNIPDINFGSNNTTLGSQSLISIAGGTFNTSVGTSALYSLTTGNNNTSVGYSTLAYTNGDSNVALGYYAGGNYFGYKVDGYQNTFLGYQTDISSGTIEPINNSTAIGANATIYQSHQVVLGTSAETINIPCGILNFLDYTNPNMSSPNYNIILNDVTGKNIPDINFGSNNTTLGSQSLISIAGGTFNTSVGTSALYSLTTGNNNTSVGYSTLAYTNGNSNVALGYYAGGNYFGNNGTDGVQNTFLGYQTDISSGTIEPINNSTAIGANAIIDASNQIMLGTETETVFCSGPSGVQIGVTGSSGDPGGVTGYVQYSDGSRQTTWNVFTNPSSDPSYGLISFGNIYMQFGTLVTDSTDIEKPVKITFSQPFPNNCLNVQATYYKYFPDDEYNNYSLTISNISSESFNVNFYGPSGFSRYPGVTWTAYGN
jgi:hypothetical protein